MNNQDFLSALDKIDAELSTPSLDSLDAGQLCATYQKIRGSLQSILPFIKLLPGWGDKLAAALSFLMTLVDKVCPA